MYTLSSKHALGNGEGLQLPTCPGNVAFTLLFKKMLIIKAFFSLFAATSKVLSVTQPLVFSHSSLNRSYTRQVLLPSSARLVLVCSGFSLLQHILADKD